MEADAVAKERIHDWMSGYTSGWVGEAPELCFDPGPPIVADLKTVKDDGEAWEQVAVGEVFSDVQQAIGVIIRDCHMNDVLYVLPSMHFQRVKTGPYTWELVLIQD